MKPTILPKVRPLLLAILLLSGCVWLYGLFKPASTPAPTDNILTQIKQRGVLHVGTTVPFKPMEYIDESGQIVGLDIDIAQAIADKLGVKLEITNYSLPDLPLAIINNQADLIISSLVITRARQSEMLMSLPYFQTGLTIVTKDTTNIQSPSDLKDKKVGAQKKSFGPSEIAQVTDPANVTFYNDQPDKLNYAATADLLKGNLDALTIDYVSALEIVKNNPSLRIIGNPFSQEYYGAATNLNNTALMEYVNQVLRDMKRNDQLQAIISKWLPIDKPFYQY